MIHFKINGSRYKICTVWKEVTYDQYVALLTLQGTLRHQISLFTGIPVDYLERVELPNLETIAVALSFLNSPPHMEASPTPIVGKYILPADVTIQSVSQFEDLRNLLNKFPRNEDGTAPALGIEENLLISDLYLTACAIYVQKIKHGKYDFNKVAEVKEELKNESCIEVIQTGAFFLFRPVNTSKPIMNRFQRLVTRLRKLNRE